MSESLLKITIRGVKWSTFGTAINAMAQLIVTISLTRLLDPSAFGLLAMASVTLRFGSYFSQMGIGPAIIQKNTITDDEIKAAFTSSMLLGILFFAIMWFAAPLTVGFFQTPEVINIVRIMALSFIISGFSVTSMNLLRRRMNFRRLAMIESMSFIVGYGVVGIVLAYRGFGVWSLVICSLIQGSMTAIMAYVSVKHKLSPTIKWQPYKELYSYGSRVSLINFLEFLGSNLDTLAVGRILGTMALGLYNKAFMLINLPVEYFVSSISKVLFPSFSQIKDQTDKLRKAYLSTFLFIGIVLTSVCFGTIPASNEIILTLFGNKWIGSIAVLQILAVATPLNFLSHISAIICDSTSNLNVKLKLQFFYVISLSLLITILSRFGLIGIATAIAIGELLRFICYVIIMERILKIKYKDFVQVFKTITIVSFSVTLSIGMITFLLRFLILPNWGILIGQIICGFASLVALSIGFPTRLLKREVKERFFNNRSIMGNSILTLLFKKFV